MDFNVTDEQKLIVEAARKICQEEIAPFSKEINDAAAYPWEYIRKLAKYDFFGVPIPKEYGGLGMDWLTWVLVGIELAQADATVGAVFGADMLCIYPILAYGTEEQKKKYLPPLAKGEKVGAFGLTEPNAGSDASAGLTTARKEGDHYILNGTKMFITNGREADTYVVTAKTNPARGARGMSAFILEKGMKGFSFGKQEHKAAYPSLANCELVFDNVKIPAENLLWKEGRGFIIAMETLNVGRIGMGIGAVGLAKAAFDAAIKYSKEREQFGQHISSFQAVQFKLADMATEIDAAQLLVERAAWMKDNNMKVEKQAAMAKLYSSEVCARVTNAAVQIHGGYGYIYDYSVERYWRESKLFELVEGTSEIQRSVIALNLLKEH